MPLSFSDISDLIGAGQKPKPNPLYGAHYVTPDDHPEIKQPMWLSANGEDVTAQMNKIAPEQHGIVTSTPFDSSGGFWHGLGSVGKSEKMANMIAQQYPGMQSQELQAKIRDIVGTSRAKTGASVDRANAFLGQSIPTQAMLAGTGDISAPNQDAFYNTIAKLGNGVYSAQAKEATALANKSAATAPAFANPSIANAVATNAIIESNKAKGELHRLPSEELTRDWIAQHGNNAAAFSDYLHNTALGLGSPSSNMLSVNPDLNNPTVGIVKNPVHPPTQMEQMNDALSSIGGTVGKTSTGNAYVKPGSNTTSGISIPPIKQPGGNYISPDQAAQEEHDRKEEIKKAHHDAAQATIASKLAALKAQSKILRAEHVSTGFFPTLGRTVAYNIGNSEGTIGYPATLAYKKILTPIGHTLWSGD